MSSILNEEREKELRKVIIANNKYEYRLKDQIGAGSFGSVYKIIDKDTKEMWFAYLFIIKNLKLINFI